MKNLEIKPMETWRMRKRKKRMCSFCKKEIEWGKHILRYAGKKFHPECAIKAGYYRTDRTA